MEQLTQTEATPRVESAAQAGRLHAEIGQSMVNTIVPKAMAIGRYLYHKKTELGHGAWLPWLESHATELGFGGTQARTYMRLYVNRRKLNLDEVSSLRLAARIVKTNRKPRQTPQETPEEIRADAYRIARLGGRLIGWFVVGFLAVGILTVLSLLFTSIIWGLL